VGCGVGLGPVGIGALVGWSVGDGICGSVGDFEGESVDVFAVVCDGVGSNVGVLEMTVDGSRVTMSSNGPSVNDRVVLGSRVGESVSVGIGARVSTNSASIVVGVGVFRSKKGSELRGTMVGLSVEGETGTRVGLNAGTGA
jgi:hypothetical protein